MPIAICLQFKRESSFRQCNYCMCIFGLGEPFDVVAFFDNPLDTTLTNIEWIVEGAGLMKPDIIKSKE